MSDVLPPADHLDEAVLAVPGVDTLYSAAPLIATVITSAVDALTRRPPSANSVLVARDKAGLSVAVKIGVTDGYAATDVCRRVHDAIMEHLRGRADQEIAEIAVTVARIG
ncbi:hypothetical protein E3O19_12250 [Cryobacterium algoritolerans]|uniref:Asp23/Gls24 family envelope stress response protein n=1 Tax=Cryobacterium algoritolerans TaxID=1259184 RepID=A0A4R8WTX9_9MICO|nr:hypothetical protein [Cryobacterium algoritolerans]TFC13238.1 hypothetical protein E3O19_12250 [Cryobacterium algoritolerans]